MIQLSGKTAYITGASSGIGRQVALSMWEAGCNVVATARSKDKLDELVSLTTSSQNPIIAIPTDVRNENDVKQSIQSAVEQLGSIDIVVHCAGITIKSPIQDMTSTQWDDVIDTNLTSCYRVAKHVFPYLRRTDSSEYSKFISIGSVGTFLGIPLSSAYCASKAGLVQVIKTLAIEWAQHHINVNAICPGYIMTPLSESVLKVGATYEKVTNRIPLGVIGNPEDIANAVLFLSSPLSNYITGSTLNVDGGLMAAAYTLEQ